MADGFREGRRFWVLLGPVGRGTGEALLVRQMVALAGKEPPQRVKIYTGVNDLAIRIPDNPAQFTVAGPPVGLISLVDVLHPASKFRQYPLNPERRVGEIVIALYQAGDLRKLPFQVLLCLASFPTRFHGWPPGP